MGFAASQYNSVKMARIAEEVYKGDRHQTGKGLDNKEHTLFQRNYIRLNLPGADGYNPTFSWVSKMWKDGQIVCNLFTLIRWRPSRVTWEDRMMCAMCDHAAKLQVHGHGRAR